MLEIIITYNKTNSLITSFKLKLYFTQKVIIDLNGKLKFFFTNNWFPWHIYTRIYEFAEKAEI